ncbi:MAG: hypothetical protein IPH57_18765 [Saprospiraceae bacterium]|nr:hypothetical protein [Saprospiraceae bacterium]
MVKNRNILLCFLILFLVLLACNQREDKNSVDVITRVGKYRIVLPEKIGFVFETIELDYKNTFSRVKWKDLKYVDNRLFCVPIYEGKRRDKSGHKRDIDNGHLYGDTPWWGKYPLLDKKIIANRDFDFITRSFIEFPNMTDDRIDYTVKSLHFRSNYQFDDICFSFDCRKYEGTKSYREILKDIELIKKIRVIKISN